MGLINLIKRLQENKRQSIFDEITEDGNQIVCHKAKKPMRRFLFYAFLFLVIGIISLIIVKENKSLLFIPISILLISLLNVVLFILYAIKPNVLAYIEREYLYIYNKPNVPLFAIKKIKAKRRLKDKDDDKKKKKKRKKKNKIDKLAYGKLTLILDNKKEIVIKDVEDCINVQKKLKKYLKI